MDLDADFGLPLLVVRLGLVGGGNLLDITPFPKYVSLSIFPLCFTMSMQSVGAVCSQ